MRCRSTPEGPKQAARPNPAGGEGMNQIREGGSEAASGKDMQLLLRAGRRGKQKRQKREDEIAAHCTTKGVMHTAA